MSSPIVTPTPPSSAVSAPNPFTVLRGQAPTAPVATPVASPSTYVAPPTVNEPIKDLSDDELFEEVFTVGVPLLENLVLQARGYQLGSPWGVLGKAICVASLDAPDASVHTGTGSRPIPLNPMIAFVAPSGFGKGMTMSAQMAYGTVALNELGPVKVTPASGEALIDAFYTTEVVDEKTGKLGPVRHNRPVWADWAEVDGLAAKAGAKGATLEPVLRSIYTGEDAGDESISRKGGGFGCTLEADTYRCAVTVGVQPKRAAPLLRDGGGGTLQRLTWLDITDTGTALHPDDIPTARADLAARLGLAHVPDSAPVITVHGPVGGVVVSQDVKDDISLQRYNVLNGTGTVDEEDTHRNNSRIRYAAIFAGWLVPPGTLAVIDTRAWRWADALLEHSSRVRKSITATAEAEDQSEALRRGRLHGLSNHAAKAAAEDMLEKEDVKNMWKLVGLVEKTPGLSARDYQAKTSRERKTRFFRHLEMAEDRDLIRSEVVGKSMILYPLTGDE